LPPVASRRMIISSTSGVANLSRRSTMETPSIVGWKPKTRSVWPYPSTRPPSGSVKGPEGASSVLSQSHRHSCQWDQSQRHSCQWDQSQHHSCQSGRTPPPATPVGAQRAQRGLLCPDSPITTSSLSVGPITTSHLSVN
jgi:hypothetical protein